MATTAQRDRGFTLLEVMVVVAIIGIVSALGFVSIRLQRPRARLVTTAAEVHSLLHGARLTAMANGRAMVVMIFPDFANPDGGTGRLVLYDDGAFSFFNPAATVNFGNYDPSALGAEAATATTPGGRMVRTFDLPEGTVFGPATGMGAGARLPAPYDTVSVDVRCSFCGGAPSRGAIAFDPSGSASFYRGMVALGGTGHSFSVTGPELTSLRTRTLVVTAGSGAVRTFLSD